MRAAFHRGDAHRVQHALQAIQRSLPGAALRMRGQQRIVRNHAWLQPRRCQVVKNRVHLQQSNPLKFWFDLVSTSICSLPGAPLMPARPLSRCL